MIICFSWGPHRRLQRQGLLGRHPNSRRGLSGLSHYRPWASPPGILPPDQQGL